MKQLHWLMSERAKFGRPSKIAQQGCPTQYDLEKIAKRLVAEARNGLPKLAQAPRAPQPKPKRVDFISLEEIGL